MTVSIKNMVCPRCIASVREIAGRCGLVPASVSLGSCEFDSEPDADSLQRFAQELKAVGFEILGGREERLVSEVKSCLLDLIYNREDYLPGLNLPDYVQRQVGASYSLVRSTFASVEGRSVDNYFICLRMERVKELLRYDELSLSEIADRLGYSSVSHLSSQFKKHTGLTPTQFKKGMYVRASLDAI